MPSSFGIRISGIPDVQGRITKFNARTLASIQQKAEVRSAKTVEAFQAAFAAEYTSAWSTGKLAAGIVAKVMQSNGGVNVQLLIPNRRELQYVTAAFGGHFQDFPVRPFVIVPTSRKFLLIPFPTGLARRFIRGKGGRFAGSSPNPGASDEGGDGIPGILVRRVLWGKRTGGFSRDVITEVSQTEGALFVDDMQQAVKKSIVELTS